MPQFHTAPDDPPDADAEPQQRNWTRTYVYVIVVEMVVLLALYWLQSHFGV
jgi:hypothetical protein